MGLEESLPSGVLLTTVEKFAGYARKGSLWPATFGLACCAIEMMGTFMSNHDLDRFGIVPWPSPRQSDVMIVSGTVTKKMAPAIKLLYEQMPNPKWVISMGACATNGGPYTRYDRVLQGVDKIIPVDVYVPGCPPRPESLLQGLMMLKRPCRVELVTDSQYLAKGISEWLAGWRANGYKRREAGKLKPLINEDLWRAVDEQVHRHQIKVTHVKGHAGHAGNERADALANRGVDSASTGASARA